MEDIKVIIQRFKIKNKLKDEECADLFGYTLEQLKQIEEGTCLLEESEITKIKQIIKERKKIKNRRIVKVIDLIFRFCATVMPLVVLLLCINGYSKNDVLITMLSIGVVCNSLVMLPRND